MPPQQNRDNGGRVKPAPRQSHSPPAQNYSRPNNGGNRRNR
jgi:hypothetical protein